MSERFSSIGADVFDSERPGFYCGFLYADTAEQIAMVFNEHPDMAVDYMWVSVDDDDVYYDDEADYDYFDYDDGYSDSEDFESDDFDDIEKEDVNV